MFREVQLRFLIIDDDQSDVQLLRKNLIMGIPGVKSAAGCYGFEPAKITLSTYNDEDTVVFPDMVIMEASLKGGSSTVLIRTIRECKGMKATPIWIYTSSTDEERIKACLTAGANKFIPKTPGKHDALVTSVKSFISDTK